MEGRQTSAQIKTAVDSSVLFDIVKGAPGAQAAQTELEAALAHGSPGGCAVIVAGLGRYFSDEQDLKGLLAACQIDHDPISIDPTLEAARTMRGYAHSKGPRERVAPDFLIGAQAIKHSDALLTTDAGFFRHFFDGLKVVAP